MASNTIRTYERGGKFHYEWVQEPVAKPGIKPQRREGIQETKQIFVPVFLCVFAPSRFSLPVSRARSRDRIAPNKFQARRHEGTGTSAAWRCGPNVVQNRKPDIDSLLNYQFDAWRRVPTYARDWNRLDDFEREVFHLEWTGVTESRLRELDRFLKQGIFTSPQRARYEELSRLITQMRPILETMFSEP